MAQYLTDVQFILGFGQLCVAAALAFLTWRLVLGTSKMAQATSTPFVTVSLEPNEEENLGYDLVIHNSGTAPAFEVVWKFEPEFVIKHSDGEQRKAQPINKHSMIRPGQIVRGYVGQHRQMTMDQLKISVSWKIAPNSKSISLSYDYSLWSYHGMAELSPKNPLRKIANEIELLRQRFLQITPASKLSVNHFDKHDREAEREKFDAALDSFKNDLDQ